MIRALSKILITLVVVLALLAGGAWFLFTQTNVPATALLESGVATSQIESALRSHEDLIAQHLGTSTEQVDAVISELDLQNWQVVEAPAGLQEKDTISFDYAGAGVSATIYDDPEYVTVNVAGQDVTLHVSEGAQAYLEQLQDPQLLESQLQDPQVQQQLQQQYPQQ